MMSFPDRVSKQNCRFGDHHKEDYVKGVEIIVVAGKNPTTRREHNVLSAHDLRDAYTVFARKRIYGMPPVGNTDVISKGTVVTETRPIPPGDYAV